MERIGDKIRQIRLQKGWSQETVANHLGISIPAVSKIEKGITDPNLSRLEEIANLFELSVIALLLWKDEENQQENEELRLLHERLFLRERQIIELQAKVIDLYDQIKGRRSS
ncbi:MAG TPA: helix-turn-helix transcriptional regulator [Mucilaginibacter sp.]|nr:helix-turn-helix transcriptional regulator [Mucilaginibacter sp.]